MEFDKCQIAAGGEMKRSVEAFMRWAELFELPNTVVPDQGFEGHSGHNGRSNIMGIGRSIWALIHSGHHSVVSD